MIEVLKQALAHGSFPQGSGIIHDLKKAIAELESQEPDKYEMDIECTKCGAKQSGVLTVNTHPPQRTEPPDWFPAVENILNEYGLQAIDFVADFKAAMKDAEKSQRTWQGLTDEEAEAIWEDHQFNGRPSEVSFANRMNLMQAIEAKLKERNDHSI